MAVFLLVDRIKRSRVVPVWFVGCSLALSLVLAAAYGYPALSGDSPAFVPAAMEFAMGKGLINPVLPSALAWDSHARLNWHGFLYPIALGWIIEALRPISAWLGLAALLAVSVINACAILAASLLYSRAISASKGERWATATSISAQFALTAFLLTYSGRPEALCVVIIAVFGQFFIGKAVATEIICGGLAVGGLAASSPVTAILAATLIAVYQSMRHQTIKALLVIAITALMSVITFAVLFVAVYPYSFHDWIIGISKHAKVSAGMHGLFFARYAYFANREVPGLGLVFGAALLSIVVLTVSKWRSIPSKILFILSSAVFCAICFSTSILNPMIYNTLPLFAVVPAVIIMVFRNISAVGKENWLPFRALQCSLIAFNCFVAIGAGLQAVEFLDYLLSGPSLRMAHERFLKETSEHPGVPINVTPSLIYLADDLDGVFDWFGTEERLSNLPIVFRQEYRMGTVTPQILPGYQLVTENYAPEPAWIRMVRLPWVTAPSYRYAMYLKIATSYGTQPAVSK